MVTFIVIADFLGSQILEGNFSEMHIKSISYNSTKTFVPNTDWMPPEYLRVCPQNDVPARPTFSLLKNSARILGLISPH